MALDTGKEVPCLNPNSCIDVCSGSDSNLNRRPDLLSRRIKNMNLVHTCNRPRRMNRDNSEERKSQF